MEILQNFQTVSSHAPLMHQIDGRIIQIAMLKHLKQTILIIAIPIEKSMELN